jgi:protein ImuB
MRSSAAPPPRIVVVWCPDWPVAAAGTPADAPVAVVHANLVVAASLAARADDVHPGLRRRAAQARCPALTLVPVDPARDARAFEVVLRAIESFTPLLELTEPGTATFLARGPSRYHGGDAALGHQVSAAVIAALADRVRATGPPGVGVADGRFAATMAARRAAFEAVRPSKTARRELVPEPSFSRSSVSKTETDGRENGVGSLKDSSLDVDSVLVPPTAVVVPPGASAAFLAPLSVSCLPDPALVDLLWRLGIRTLGQLAALPAADVLGRFGSAGLQAHQAANGLDDRPPGARSPPPELTVHESFEPPVLQSGPVVFTAKHLADDLHADLAGRGMVVTTCLVRVETEHGEQHERTWHHGPGFTPASLAERVRWQLEGWAQGPAAPTGGITSLRLVPIEVVADVGRQLGFWGGDRLRDERASRAAARLSGLLGSEAVTVPEWHGGRDPAEGFVAVPAAAVELIERGRVGPPAGAGPWPGRLPLPSPARVPAALVPAAVTDETGRHVAVSGRGVASGAPAHLVVGRGETRRVKAWAGPWPLDERWWDPAGHRRRARFQVVTEDGQAHLLVLARDRWWVAATYD